MIPQELKDELSANPYYSKCARANQDCSGRITWEHSLTYKGRKLQEKFAIIPLCVYHHLGNGLDKRKNRELSLMRMTKKDIINYPDLRKLNGFAYMGNKVYANAKRIVNG